MPSNEAKIDVDVFDVKADVVKTLIELGIEENNLYVSNTSLGFDLKDQNLRKLKLKKINLK